MRCGPTALAFGISLACCVAAEAGFAQKQSAERPSYEVGMRWLLNDGAYDLIRSTSDVYFFAAGPTRKIQLTRDLGLYQVLKDGNVDWQMDPPPPIKWPLEVGKFGTLFNAVMHSREIPSGLPVRFTWEVKAYESVRVPAGVYQAFRIVYLAEYIGDPLRRSGGVPGRQYWNIVMWYAPEARQIVKAEGAGLRGLDFQLVAADGGTPAPLQVLLNDPKDQAHVSDAQTQVGGKITAGAGVARVSATINGSEIHARAERSPPPELALSFSVPLREGKNVLLVTVTDTNGQTKQEARVIFRDRPGSLPSAVPPATPAPSSSIPAPPSAAPATVPPPAAATLQVTISSPRDQARVDQESIALAGLASSGKGIRRVLVMVNGVEVSRMEERAPQRTFPVNFPLKLRDGQNTIVVTATDADGATQQDVRAVFFDRVVPLTVQFRHPENGARVSDQSSLVAAEISSGKGIASVNVLLNGTEVLKQAERPPKKSIAVAAPVKLREGSNTIIIRASEPDGTVRQEVRTVVYERAAPVQPAEPVLAAKPNREQWAVVIGVGAYKSTAIPQLRYSVADAELVHQVLVGQGGFKKENVLLLTDRTERKPTLRDLKWALGTFLARSAKKDDLILIFFAGHGAPYLRLPAYAGGTRGRGVPGPAHALQGARHRHRLAGIRGVPRGAGAGPRSVHPLSRPGSPGRRRSRPGRDCVAPGGVPVPRAAGDAEVPFHRRQSASGDEGGARRPAASGQGEWAMKASIGTVVAIGALSLVVWTVVYIYNPSTPLRSEEHTSELQSLAYLVCRLLLEKKKKMRYRTTAPTLSRPYSKFRPH